MREILNKLYLGSSLCQQESQSLFETIIQGQLDPIDLSAAIISMKVRGENPEEITGAVQALLKHAKPFSRPDYPFADIVGTGGDGCNSINISTASCFVAAAAGFSVAKQGNQSVSSKTGSSDVLREFGINLNMSAEQARKSLDELGICFLFAQQYHGGFQFAAPIRKQLKTRTIFNVLGPLINPASPPIALIGVYSPNLIPTIAQTLCQLGYQHAAVVHGSGLDEVAIHGETQVAEIHDGKIHFYTLTPEDFGCHRYSLESLQGGEPQHNHYLLTQLLDGRGKPAHEAAVAVNVAMLMKLFGHTNLQQNTEFALSVIKSGQPLTLVNKLAARG